MSLPASMTAKPEQTKALLRILIAELRVNSRHDIQSTHRIITPDRTHTAGVCATSEKVGARMSRKADEGRVRMRSPCWRA
jgi:hypothetical protein